MRRQRRARRRPAPSPQRAAPAPRPARSAPCRPASGRRAVPRALPPAHPGGARRWRRSRAGVRRRRRASAPVAGPRGTSCQRKSGFAGGGGGRVVAGRPARGEVLCMDAEVARVSADCPAFLQPAHSRARGNRHAVSYRATVLTRPGGPEVLEVRDLPMPTWPWRGDRGSAQAASEAPTSPSPGVVSVRTSNPIWCPATRSSAPSMPWVKGSAGCSRATGGGYHGARRVRRGHRPESGGIRAGSRRPRCRRGGRADPEAT